MRFYGIFSKILKNIEKFLKKLWQYITLYAKIIVDSYKLSKYNS